MYEQKRIAELADKWLNGTASKEEQQELFDWWRQHPENPIELPEGFADSEEALQQRMLLNMQQAIQAENKPVISIKKWLPYAAAAIILIIAGSVYYMSVSSTARTAPQVAKIAPDINPGSQKAILTLADGTQITIDNATNGTIAEQHGVNVVKQDGQIIYNAGVAKQNTVLTYNTMSTPRGGTYQLVLPDGTRAWLNAASGIRYPVMFTGRERKVEITGEVYFEVAKNKSKPFIVQAAGQQVEVTGTHFNVNSYTDEPHTITTLLEGSVIVNNKALVPGQSFANGKVQPADIQKAVAWTKGITWFDKTSITEMMRQVSRWYDIDVQYNGIDTTRTFTGQVPRGAKLSTILKLLSAIDIHYTLDPGNKKIILHP